MYYITFKSELFYCIYFLNCVNSLMSSMGAMLYSSVCSERDEEKYVHLKSAVYIHIGWSH